MSATLTVVREGFGIELRHGTFDVRLDGESVGSIDRHETIEAPVEPGRHELRIRSGRYSSRPRSFDALEGERVKFRCHPAMVWLRYLPSLVWPSLGISLRRE